MTQNKEIDWDELYAEYQTSGLSKNGFSKMKGISKDLVYKHFRRLDLMQQKPEAADLKAEPECSFMRVQMQKLPETVRKAKLTLRFEKFSIDIDDGTDMEFLSGVLRSLNSSC